jgi:peptide/nickel transport system substrate-binding protein
MMTRGITRRAFAAFAGGAALSASKLLAWANADQKTLRFILRSDLRVLDPLWTTTYATRNHGYMIFDTLFALDSSFRPCPQMVRDYSTSADKLTYYFTLREGLKFHDGQPVRGTDCVASLHRWMARDTLGQALALIINEMTDEGDRKFVMRLKEPFPLLLAGLAKVSSLVPFIMPERLAKTDPHQQITETVGSGPFKFVADEFQPGYKAVYVKNTEYVPRDEPPSWASGGKVVKVDRVEWLYVPEHATAAEALGSGEFDWWETVPPDLAPMLASNPAVTVENSDPIGSMAMLRFNHLQPPFNNVQMRRAVLAVTDQTEFMTAIAGDSKNWKVCPSFFACGAPMASTTDSEALTGKRDFDGAKRLIAEAGYKGEKVIVLDGVDQQAFHSIALVAADLLKKLDLNVELVSSAWSTLVSRRASKKSAAEGGWSIVPTSFTGVETLDPSANLPLAMNGDAAWFGWPTDAQLESLRTEWIRTSDENTRKEIAAQIQARAFEVVPYVPLGQFFEMTAYRKNLKGVIIAPAEFMWNVEKT